MRVEFGAPVVLVAGVDALWHIPDGEDGETKCGLAGDAFVFSTVLRRRRCCAICRKRHRGDVVVPELGPLPPRRAHGSGKPKGVHARVTDAQLRALHHLYVTERVSVRELGRRYWQRLGYKNAHACGQSLDGLFRDRGLPLRSRSEALVLRNTKHGRRRRELSETGPDVAEYRRWLKAEQGRYRPTCKGIKSTSPRKGSPCTRHAMAGSDYCFGHDPARKEERDRITAGMRALQPRPAMVSFAPVLAHLRPWLDLHQHPASRLAEATGVPQGTCSRLLKHRPELVTADMAERLLVAVEMRAAA